MAHTSLPLAAPPRDTFFSNKLKWTPKMVLALALLSAFISFAVVNNSLMSPAQAPEIQPEKRQNVDVDLHKSLEPERSLKRQPSDSSERSQSYHEDIQAVSRNSSDQLTSATHSHISSNLAIATDSCNCSSSRHSKSDELFRHRKIFEGTDSEFEMYTYPSKKADAVSTSVMQRGTFQDAEMTLIHDRLRIDAENGEEAVLVDIGANIGWFTFSAAAKGYRVIAFEPLPSNRDIFCATYCANPVLQSRIEFYHIGLSDQRGMCYMRSMGKKNEGNAQMFCEHDANHSEPVVQGSRREGIPVYLLDDVLHTRASIMKLDVEVYTNPVLRGARKVFETELIRFVQNELWTFDATHWTEYSTFFESLGFEIHEDNFEGCQGTSPAENNVKEFYTCKRGVAGCSNANCTR